jgi:hypothetical protein
MRSRSTDQSPKINSTAWSHIFKTPDSFQSLFSGVLTGISSDFECETYPRERRIYDEPRLNREIPTKPTSDAAGSPGALGTDRRAPRGVMQGQITVGSDDYSIPTSATGI